MFCMQLAKVLKLTCKGQHKNPTAIWPPVPSGSGHLSLFRIETGQNCMELPVSQRLGFEVVPYPIWTMDKMS